MNYAKFSLTAYALNLWLAEINYVEVLIFHRHSFKWRNVRQAHKYLSLFIVNHI